MSVSSGGSWSMGPVRSLHYCSRLVACHLCVDFFATFSACYFVFCQAILPVLSVSFHPDRSLFGSRPPASHLCQNLHLFDQVYQTYLPLSCFPHCQTILPMFALYLHPGHFLFCSHLLEPHLCHLIQTVQVYHKNLIPFFVCFYWP